MEEEIDDVREVMQSVRKKKKTKEYSILQKLKKPKMVRPRTNIARWAAIVYKNKAKDLNAIRNLIEKEFKVSPDDLSLRILDVLSKAKIIDGRVVLSDNFANEPFYGYGFVNYDMHLVSNDKLFNYFFYARALKELKSGSLYNDVFKTQSQYARLDKVFVSSKAFILEKEIIRGFYQDFKEYEAYLGPTKKPTNEEIQKYADKINYENPFLIFTADNIRYYAYAPAGFDILSVVEADKASKETIISGLTNMEIFNKGKKDLELNVKEIKLKNKKAFYFDCSYNLESFCPAFVKLEKSLNLVFVYRYKFIMNDLYNAMIIEFNNKRFDSHVLFNLCYWDNIESFMDLISLAAVGNSSTDETKRYALNVIAAYQDLKETISLWKKNQLNYQKILKDFYNSFNTNINYDKLRNLRDNLIKYLADRNDLELYSDFDKMESFFNGLGCMCQYIIKQLRKNVMYLANRMNAVLDEFIMGKFTSDITKDLNEIGQSIYTVSMNGSDSCFNFFVSYGAFLGDVSNFSGAIRENIIETTVEKYIKKLDKAEEERLKKLKNFREINSNMRKIVEDLVTKCFDLIVNDKKLEIEKDLRDRLVGDINNEIAWDTDLYNKIRDKVLERNLLSGTLVNPIEVVSLLSPIINRVIDSTALEAKREILKKEIEEYKKEKDRVDHPYDAWGPEPLKEGTIDTSTKTLMGPRVKPIISSKPIMSTSMKPPASTSAKPSLDISRIGYAAIPKVDGPVVPPPTIPAVVPPFSGFVDINAPPTKDVIPVINEIEMGGDEIKSGEKTEKKSEDDFFNIGEGTGSAEGTNTDLNARENTNILPNININTNTDTLFKSNIPQTNIESQTTNTNIANAPANPPSKKKKNKISIINSDYEVSADEDESGNLLKYKESFISNKKDIDKNDSFISKAKKIISKPFIGKKKPKQETKKKIETNKKQLTQLDKKILEDKKKEEELDRMLKRAEIFRKEEEAKSKYRIGDYNEYENDDFVEKDYSFNLGGYQAPGTVVRKITTGLSEVKGKCYFNKKIISDEMYEKIIRYIFTIFRFLETNKVFKMGINYVPIDVYKSVKKNFPISDQELSEIVTVIRRIRGTTLSRVATIYNALNSNDYDIIKLGIGKPTPRTLYVLKELMNKIAKKYVKYKISEAKEKEIES